MNKLFLIFVCGVILGNQDSLLIDKNQDSLLINKKKNSWKLNLLPMGSGFVPLGQLENNKPFKAITILALRHYWFNEFKIAKNLGKIADRNRSFWWMFFLHFYAIIDAYVDSHLDHFPEVDENNLNNSE